MKNIIAGRLSEKELSLGEKQTGLKTFVGNIQHPNDLDINVREDCSFNFNSPDLSTLKTISVPQRHREH